MKTEELGILFDIQEDANIVVYLDIETMGLNAYTDRVTCIGLIISENNNIVYSKSIFNKNEEKLLKEFLKVYMKYKDRITETVTWNGDKFDHNFLDVRCLKYGIRYKAINSEDIKNEFPKFMLGDTWRKPSLGDAINFLEIKDSKYGTGEEAPYLFKHGKIDELKRYCLQDVKLLRKINIELGRRGR